MPMTHNPAEALREMEAPRIIECGHCKGLGWYETGEKIESGDGWNEPYHCERVEAFCEECDGTGWAK